MASALPASGAEAEMSGPFGLLQELGAALRPHGLFLRGVVNFADGDEAPVLSTGIRAASVVLIGNIGGSVWQAFSDWRAAQTDGGGEHPLDAWSKAVIGRIALRAGATAFFPSDPPWQPFQQWAMRAEGLKPSPLGILRHPEFGLWHGYRAALAFAFVLPASPVPQVDQGCLCDTGERGRVSTCPAGAVARSGFNVASCRAYLATAQGQATCMANGCAARNACPCGSAYRYGPQQLRFHMAALGLPSV